MNQSPYSRDFAKSPSRLLRLGLSFSLALCMATISLVGVQLSDPLAANAVERITKQTGFNARAFSVTTPDSTGTRYIGGDFTSYQAWETGFGVAVGATDATVDASFPKVSGWPYAEAVVSDGAGGWYIGGGINNVGGSGTSRVVHLFADGSLDTAFSPNVSGGQGVFAIAKYGSVILIGGNFTSVNGVARDRLAALDASGNLLSWAPSANGGVLDIQILNDTAYISGNFSQLAGSTRGLVAAVSLGARSSGGATCLSSWDSTDCLTPWNPNAAGWGVKSIAVSSDFTYLAGAISSVGGVARSNVAKVSTTTGVLQSWDAQVNSEVERVVVSAGVAYLGGLFTAAGGATRNKLAAFDAATDALLSWNPDVSGNTVTALSVQGSTIYVGGKFSFVGGQGRNHAAAIDVSGTVLSWDPHICDQANGTQAQVFGLESDGTKVYMLGDFSCVGGLKRLHAAAVTKDGTLSNWAPMLNGSVRTFSRSGNNIYIGGYFSQVNGVDRSKAAAVDVNGQLMPWNPSLNDRPEVIIAKANRVYLGGWFSTVGGIAQRNLAAVDPTLGALDTSFDSSLNGAVRAMTISGDNLYIGGDFTSVGSEAHNYVTSVNAGSGNVNSAFTAGTASGTKTYPFLEAIAVVGSRVFIGGEFGIVNGQVRNFLAAVDATTGALDVTWNPNSSRAVYDIDSAPDGSVVYVGNHGGSIGSAPNQPVGIAALDPISGLPTSWRANTGEVRGVSASDAGVFIAGSFSSVGGLGRANTAAISNTGNVLNSWPMNAATSLPLGVSMTAAGASSVISDPGGINCGDSCDYSYLPGDSVTLTAVPATGQTFSGWAGACSGSALTCTLTMTQATLISANFGSLTQSGQGSNQVGAGLQPAVAIGSPNIRDISSKTSSIGGSLRISGGNLDAVKSVKIDGVMAEIKSQSDALLELTVPSNLVLGFKDIVISSSFGDLTYLGAFELVAKQRVPNNKLLKAASFRGQVVIYAKGYSGKKISAKVAGKWLSKNSAESNFITLGRRATPGKSIRVSIFVEGKIQREFELQTK